MRFFCLLLLIFFVGSVHATGVRFSGSSSICFSDTSAACSYMAQTFSGGPYQYWKVSGNLCIVAKNSSFNPSGGSSTSTTCDDACPAGQVRNSNGVCSCPSGQVLVNGQCTCQEIGFGAVKNDGGQCKPDCAARAGKSFGTMFDLATSGGCPVSCVGVVGGAWPVQCTYVGSGTGTSDGNVDPTIPGATPPNNSTPKDPAAPCPANTYAGTVNGQQYCAPKSDSSSTPPVQPGQPQTTTTQSDTVETRTSTTTTNADGSTTTVTRVTVTTTGTQTGATQGNSGSGSGTGSGGEGSGAGECDPTSKGYLDCIGSSTLPDHTTASASSFGEAATNFWTQFNDTPVGHLAGGAGIGGEVAVGSCPAPTLEFFGHSFSLNIMCSIYDSISSTLGTVMNVIYVMAGILIILSA